VTGQPQGKSLKELRAIVLADEERFNRLGVLWSYLSDDEQEQLIATAKGMAGDDVEVEP
jgi:hypothetical protein